MIKDQAIQKFLDDLASKASTPGGGSAAAIMGAMGAALNSMVANFTVGKKGYEDVDQQAQDILKQSENIRNSMTDMIKADIDVFNLLLRDLIKLQMSILLIGFKQPVIALSIKSKPVVIANDHVFCSNLID